MRAGALAGGCRSTRVVRVPMRVVIAGMALGLGGMLPGVVHAQDAEVISGRLAASEEDGRAFVVDQIDLVYAWSREGEAFAEHPSLPPVESLLDTAVRLVQLEDGFAGPRPGAAVPTVRLTIAQLNAMGEKRLYRSAIVAIMEAIRSRLNRSGVIGVFAYPPDVVLAGAGEDRRAEGDLGLHVRVLIGWVEDVRTIGGGERFGDESVRNAPEHARIRRLSPVQPSTPEARDVLDRRALDDYVLRLNRHPGRVVNLGVGPGSGVSDGSVVVDYHIYEAKPWYGYFQVSNTGTEETNEWRERFGFVHNQLTNNDDILTIDYVTAGFEDSHAIVANYEAPFGDSEHLRWRVGASWNEFTGSDIGGDPRDDIEGDGWSVTGEAIWNVYQEGEIFVDVVGGIRYHEVSFDSPTLSGDGSFFLPKIGATVERFTDISSFTAGADIEVGLASENERELERLGRTDVDDQWVMLSYDFEWSFFLEPVFFREEFEDPDTTWNPRKTLAHEFSMRLRGQETFGARVVPNYQAVTGGAASVRGYPESEVPSDSVVVFSAEYRFHVPRSFAPSAEPGTLLGQPFKIRPQRTWGRPDWDLVLKGFVDAARATNYGDVSFEADETLVGVGVGAELRVKRNFVMSLDWGFALADTEEVDSGDNELHFILTLLY